MFKFTAFAAAVLIAPMAMADTHSASPTGDAEAGEAAFRACIACHVVRDDEDNVLAGRNARTGPNLYAIAGRVAGSVEGFRYSSGMQAANETGLVWDEAGFVSYVPNATSFLRELTGDARARSTMTPQRIDEETAADLWAFLVSLAPPAEAPEEEAASE